jgi:hypothetical protein
MGRLDVSRGASQDAHRAALGARSTEPSWGTVLATTLRLWGQRRLRPLWSTRVGGFVTAALAMLVLLVVAGGLTLLLNHNGGTTHQATSSTGETGTTGASGSQALTGAATIRRQAAAWVASQVAGNAIVGCDAAMCAALQARHLSSGRLLVLQPDQEGPSGATVVVATAAVRSLYGAKLTSDYAPAVLAVFGSGPAQIDVRVVASYGGAAYRANLSRDLAERKVFGASLARNPDIHLAPAARGQLLAGQVDARLLMNLAALATDHQMDVLSFGGLPGHGASPGIPLRSAVVAPGSSTESPQALRRFLLAQQPLFHPSAVTLVKTSSGQAALRIQFPAPTPLDLLGTRHS